MSWHNPALVCTIRLQHMKTSTNKTIHIDETPPEASACSVIYGRRVWREPTRCSLAISRHADSTLKWSHPDVHYPLTQTEGGGLHICVAQHIS